MAVQGNCPYPASEPPRILDWELGEERPHSGGQLGEALFMYNVRDISGLNNILKLDSFRLITKVGSKDSLVCV